MKIFITVANTPKAQKAYRELIPLYTSVLVEDADVIVCIGGDGFMLETIHTHMHYQKPFYGINLGSLGFLLNPFESKDLFQKLEATQSITLYPLHMKAHTVCDQVIDAFAINEVSVFRQTTQAAKIKIKVDGIMRLDHLVGDGILIATPAGSTAYNYSAHGPILPIAANLLALTPITPFRPRSWRGALLHQKSVIEWIIEEPTRRIVSATADSKQMQDVRYVKVQQAFQNPFVLLFDQHHPLEERIFKEQFVV